MADLIEGLSPLRIRFGCSLSHSVLATASLLCAASRFEGLGDWLRETRARLPAELCEELCTCLAFPVATSASRRTIARLPAEAFDATFDELLAQLDAIPDMHYQLIALRALARGASPSPTQRTAGPVEKPPEWAAYLTGVGSEVAPAQVAALVRDGNGQDTVDSSAGAVLARGLCPGIRSHALLMERSVAHHGAKYRSPASERPLPRSPAGSCRSRSPRLCPASPMSSLSPPATWVPTWPTLSSADNLYLYYNCRSTPASERGRRGAHCTLRSRHWPTRHGCRF